MNHKLLVPLVLLAFALFDLPAQTADPAPLATEVVESGKRLFIEAAEDVTITLDGQVLGNAPLLVNLGTRQEARLQFDTPYASCTRTFRINPAITAITSCSPRLETLLTSLQTSGIPEADSLILVDGKPVQAQAGRIQGLIPGPREITIMAPGLASMKTTMELKARSENSLSFIPVKGYALDFGPGMNQDGLIAVLDQDNKPSCIWRVSEKPLLAAGNAKFRISDPARFRTWDLEGDPAELSASTIFLDAKASTASLVYRSSNDKSALSANQNVLEKSKDSKYSVPEGFTTITVTEGGSVVGTDIAVLPKNGLVDASVIREPLIIGGGKSQSKAELERDHSAFWVMLISGAAILGTSLVMNQDDIMISMTQDYEGYSIGKYITFGSTGLGIALMATSLFF